MKIKNIFNIGANIVESIPNVFYRNISFQDKRYFAISAGNCGSRYIVELLKANGYTQAFHEKEPSLDGLGVKFYIDGKNRNIIKLLLRLTRADVRFEASNRLFSLTPLIKEVFSNSRFIFQYRNPEDSLLSIINKNIWPDWFKNNPRLRYSSLLAGAKNLSPFERTCHYWKNIHERILDDLHGEDYLMLSFEDLISGNISSLEDFLGFNLKIKNIPPVNTKDRLKKGGKKYESFSDLSMSDRQIFYSICGDTIGRLKKLE